MADKLQYNPRRDAEIAEIEAYQRRQASIQSAALAAQPSQAQALRAMQAYFPFNDPQVNVALGLDGQDPEGELAQEVARRTVNKRKKKGWARVGAILNPVDDIAKHGGWAVREGVEQIGNAASFVTEQVAKPVVRGTMLALESPLQEVQALIKAGLTAAGAGAEDMGFGEAYAKAGHSTLAIALSRAAGGGSFDLGTGFFTGGEVEEQYKKESSRLKDAHGQSMTLGRFLADTIADPGDWYYGLASGAMDFGVALGLDPATYLTAGAGKAARGRKMLTAAPESLRVGAAGNALTRLGVVKGRTVDTLEEAYNGWKATKGADFFTALAKEDDPLRLWQLTGKKWDVRMVNEMAKESDPRAIEAIMDAAYYDPSTYTNAMYYKPKIHSFKTKIADKPIFRSRAWLDMPGKKISIDNPNEVVEEMHTLAKTAKLGDETTSEIMKKVFSAYDGTLEPHQIPLRVHEILVDDVLVNGIAKNLVDEGLDPHHAAEIVGFNRGVYKSMQNDLIEGLAKRRAGDKSPIMIGGELQETMSDSKLLEMIQEGAPLPDIREVKRQTSFLADLYRNGAVGPTLGSAVNLMDDVMSTIWKPMKLLRGAWTVRVIGEENVRLNSVGLKSGIDHPISAIAYLLGMPGSKTNKYAELAKGGLVDDVLADSDAWQEAAAKGRNQFGYTNQGRDVIKYKQTYRDVNDPKFHEAWAQELVDLAENPVFRDALQSPSLEEFYVKFNRSQAAEALAKYGDNAQIDKIAESSREYAEAMFERIDALTGLNPTLREMVAKGTINGKPLRNRSLLTQQIGRGKKSQFSDELMDAIRGIVNDPNKVKPEAVIGWEMGRKNLKTVDDAVEYMFRALQTVPTNKLSRGPAFRQMFWQRADSLMQELSPEEAQRVLARAREAELPMVLMKRIEEGATRAKGKLTLEHVDALAKDWAITKTKELLYDATKNSQWADSMRLIMPFGEAWKEVATTWAKIGKHNPDVIRKFQKTVEAARGSGFFTVNEQGQEVWAIPGSTWLTEKLGVGPATIGGSVAGLNMLSQSVLPGVGPVVQIPAQTILSDSPQWDEIKSFLMPFGETSLSDLFVPSALQAFKNKIMPSEETERQHAKNVSEQMIYLLSTGNYSTQSVEEQNRLLSEAKNRARKLTILEAIAGQALPTVPKHELYAKDKTGRLVLQDKLLTEMKTPKADGSMPTADDIFQKYGDQLFMLWIPKGYQVVPGTPEPETVPNKWVRANDDLRKTFRNTYGFFAPQGGQFDYSAYLRQLETGERISLTPEQMIHMTNDRLGGAIYYTLKSSLGPKLSQTQRAALKSVRQELEKQYPGFGKTLPLPQRASNDELVAEVIEASKNEKIAATPAGQALKTYLQARDAAIAAQGDKSMQEAAQNKHLREALRWLGDQLSDSVPEFASLYDRVLERELKDDVVDAPSLSEIGGILGNRGEAAIGGK